jgi:hypothetical protein
VEATLIELVSGGINGAVPTTTPLQTLVYGRDWSYVERSNTLRGKPHKTLSFHTGCCCGSGVSGVLRITGTWGYSASIRADVWTLVLEYAAALAAPAVQSANSLGVATGAPSAGSAAAGTGLVEIEVKTEEVSRKFGVISKDAASLGFNTLAKPGTWAAGVDTRMQALAARLRGPVMA